MQDTNQNLRQVASAQTLVPVVSGVNISPYRIVRIVDREGRITGVRQNSETTLECTRQVKITNLLCSTLFAYFRSVQAT